MAKFKPVFIKSQFNHVYAVVCCEDDIYYLTVYTEKSVPLFGPSLPGKNHSTGLSNWKAAEADWTCE